MNCSVQKINGDRIKSIVLMLALLWGLAAVGQRTISKSKQAQIDRLLDSHKGNRPGYALGIIEKGKLIYSKGYGMANLEYGIGISDSSVFYIGSMAKQFITAALLILENEGQLNFKKPVTDYLPDFPSYDHEITLEHLIHHTSGIRETNSLQLFQGIDRKFEEVFSTNDLYELLKTQEGLNFTPGSAYRYSSGGYIVLAKLIEKVSGQSLRSFMEKRVFTPLGMNKTFISDNHNEVVPNRVISYWPIEEGQFERRSQVFETYGDGGIMTTVQDLANWDKAFYDDLLGVKDFAKKMYQKGILNNEETIDYARALNVWDYKGQRVVQHNGGMLGFRVDMVRFPELETTIILLGNSAYLDPTGDALKIAEILSENFSPKKVDSVEKKVGPGKGTHIPNTVSQGRAGYYWTDEMNYYRRISFENDSLFVDSGNKEDKQYLIPDSDMEYILKGSEERIRLVFEPKNDTEILKIYFGKLMRTFRKFDAEPPRKLEELTKYIGVYESKELRTSYSIFRRQNALFLRINTGEPMQIYPLEADSNMVWNGKEMLWIGFGELKFKGNDNGYVKGFAIGDQRVSEVWFKKIK